MAFKVTVVGVGLVGETIVSCLKERHFPCEWPPRIAATRARSETMGNEVFGVEETSADVFRNADLVLFAGKEGARGASATWRETALQEGAFCIDNGRDFRLSPDVPLVVPEVNADALNAESRFIASPNCSTIQLVAALAPVHRAARIRRIIVAGYQSTSGWGLRGPEELRAQTPPALKSLDDIPYDPEVFPRPIAFNCIPQIEPFMDDDYTREELKLVYETRKILGDGDIQVSATCVRVPVFVGHGQAVWFETERPVSPDEVRGLMSDAAGVRVPDGPDLPYPTSLDVNRFPDDVLVGRIRRDISRENGIACWIVADNLRKGAALNVVQIAESLIQKGILKA
ncbi:aspartate-semialdehyde dehydrogenase [bacterium]|nr:aspartate-semialdehyde dehydrogenase [bacterium]